MTEHAAENETAGVNEYFGIDLGTTYSCIARIGRFGRAEIISNLDGDRTTPSVVYFVSATDTLVGKAAKQELAIDSEQGVSLVKRQMRDPEWRKRIHGEEFSASVISAQILGYLKESAERMTGSDVRGVVITVPAYFGATEREATRLAGINAGLEVMGIINEPTAAAFFHGLEDANGDDEQGGEKTLLVYDLGGGTFDVTVMTASREKLTVRSTGGDSELGGANWDDQLVNLMLAKFRDAHPDSPDMSFDLDVRAKLALNAEELKWALSQVDRKNISVVIDGLSARIEVTREEFEAATSHLLGKTIEMTESTLAAAREKGVTGIDRILLVGGSSKMPAVAARLAQEFGVEPELKEPDLAVAMGAALIAAREGLLRELTTEAGTAETGDSGDTGALPSAADIERAKVRAAQIGMPAVVAEEIFKPFTNVCSQGFGIVVHDQVSGELIVDFHAHRNDELPIVGPEVTYGTRFDDQSAIEIKLMEQATDTESSRIEDNRDVPGATGVFEGIPAGHPAETPVRIQFEMTPEGRITVTGFHPGYPGTMTVTAETGSLLSVERVEQERVQSSQLQRMD